MMARADFKQYMKRLATYVPEPIYEYLDQWAAEEKRSLSNLVAYLLEENVRLRQREKASEPKEKP